MSEKKSAEAAALGGSEFATPPVDVDWSDLAAFAAIARHGGLSAAAREIGSSPPTLGRRMRVLERQLGRELFVRRTHGYELTDEGRQLRAQLAPAEAIIARATLPAPKDALPVVRIAAGTWTILAIVEYLQMLTGQPEDLKLRLLQGEDVLSIPRREASIGFRSQRPTQDGLAGRKLRRVEFAPYAAPGGADRWIVVRAGTPSSDWVMERCGAGGGVETDTPRLALDLALGGLGKAVLPTFIGDSQPGLEPLSPKIPELGHDQWLVTHDEDRHLPEVRRVLDRLSEVFA